MAIRMKMTVGKLREEIKNLPDNMPVFVGCEGYTKFDDLEERINHKIPKYHHTALTLGYVSTKNTDGIKSDYTGRFGTGFTIKRHNPSSTRFCFIDYYIYK